MEYFSPAIQLGLTATPKRKGNVDTYAYFGEPVYIYSLKEGINDGFLSPFKVNQIATTIDDYRYTSDDSIVQGEVEQGKLYGEKEFNRTIETEEREAYRVKLFMDRIDQTQKILVFCSIQEHALLIRDLINKQKQNQDTNYCIRVTANDGEEGERWLRVFQDNEKTIPTILTTSQKLSTGVDARNIRNIVLMRPISSIIEFKQIIGRGTRLFDGKDYFTIYDFVRAYEFFSDPEWDGEPLEPEVCKRCGNSPCTCVIDPPEPCPVCGKSPCECVKEPETCPICGQTPCVCNNKVIIKIKLADGKARTIQHISATSFWGQDGQPISAAQFIEGLYGELPELFKDEDELRILWSNPDTRKNLLKGLEEKGYGLDQLKEVKQLINAENSDLFDVLAYIAYALPPISREERVNGHKNGFINKYTDPQKEFLSFVLGHYISQGVGELDQAKLPDLLQLKYHSIGDAMTELGSASEILDVFIGFQKHLYEPQMTM
ncbi:type I restriction-modification enzyme R subunit C-terminal domain-containing protein [Desulfocicer niacini]